MDSDYFRIKISKICSYLRTSENRLTFSISASLAMTYIISKFKTTAMYSDFNAQVNSLQERMNRKIYFHHVTDIFTRSALLGIFVFSGLYAFSNYCISDEDYEIIEKEKKEKEDIKAEELEKKKKEITDNQIHQELIQKGSIIFENEVQRNQLVYDKKDKKIKMKEDYDYFTQHSYKQKELERRNQDEKFQEKLKQRKLVDSYLKENFNKK